MRTTDDLPINNPCHADWDGMRNEGARRFCDSCSKHVHNLSAMTEREAGKLLAASTGQRVCVRYTCDAGTGKIKFKPEPTPAPIVPIGALTRRTARRPAPARHAAAVALALAACTPHERGDQPRPTITVEAETTPGTGPVPVQPHQVVQPEPRQIEIMGEAPAIDPEPTVDEPCDTPEPSIREHVKMGKIAPRVIDPPPEATPKPEELELMGDVALEG